MLADAESMAEGLSHKQGSFSTVAAKSPLRFGVFAFQPTFRSAEATALSL
jgi:hypothetical protein